MNHDSWPVTKHTIDGINVLIAEGKDFRLTFDEVGGKAENFCLSERVFDKETEAFNYEEIEANFEKAVVPDNWDDEDQVADFVSDAIEHVQHA